MTDANPIAALTREYTMILQVVRALHTLKEHIEQGTRVDASTLRAAGDYFREYADVRKGVPESGCPLGALRSEHVKGRRLVARFHDAIEPYDAGDPAGASDLVAAIDAIHELYPNHIWKEDEMVFPMVGRLFEPVDLQELQRRFEQADGELGANRDRHIEFATRIAQDTASLRDAAE